MLGDGAQEQGGEPEVAWAIDRKVSDGRAARLWTTTRRCRRCGDQLAIAYCFSLRNSVDCPMRSCFAVSARLPRWR